NMFDSKYIMDKENFEFKFLSLAFDVAKAVAAFHKTNSDQLESSMVGNAENCEAKKELVLLAEIPFETIFT
ncbi:MAG: hypothetical protein MUO77_17580, partial [Anaerolineales bacterium]|nr:hypothetical protein [Anaerolineales bacterium]